MLDAAKYVGVSKRYLDKRAVQWERIDISALSTVPMSRLDLEKFRQLRLHAEVVKKPKDPLEYEVVYEMLHLIAPTHSEQFLALMSKHYPAWRNARAELNELALGAAVWNE